MEKVDNNVNKCFGEGKRGSSSFTSQGNTEVEDSILHPLDNQKLRLDNSKC